MRYAILSAGQGSRLAAEGFSKPKPLVPLAGMPMIERLAGIFMRCGAERIAVIVNSQHRETVDLLEDMAARMPIDLVVKDTPSPMHSLMELAPYLKGGKFCVTTVDTVFDERRFAAMTDSFLTSDYDGMMGVTALVDDEKPLYVGTDSDMMITGFHDEKGDCRFVSAGIYALTPVALDILAGCVESGNLRMRHFQRRLLAAGLKLKAFDMGRVIDVDHVSDVQKAEYEISCSQS